MKPLAIIKKHPVTSIAIVGGGVLLLVIASSGGNKSSGAQAVGPSGPSDAAIQAGAQVAGATLAYNASVNQLSADTTTHLADTYSARDVALASVGADVDKTRIAGDVAMYTVGSQSAAAMHQSDNDLSAIFNTNKAAVSLADIQRVGATDIARFGVDQAVGVAVQQRIGMTDVARLNVDAASVNAGAATQIAYQQAVTSQVMSANQLAASKYVAKQENKGGFSISIPGFGGIGVQK